MFFRYLYIGLFFSSFLFSEQPSVDKEYLLLVTGCGRGGTCYIGVLLRKCGLHIGHEHLGNDGISSWPLAVEANWPVWGPSSKGLHFAHIFHQVRDPLAVISSWYFNKIDDGRTWEYIYRLIPEISREEPFLVRCAQYWYYWNIEAGKRAEFRYRVEDVADVIDEIEERLGVSLNKENIDKVSTKMNSWREISHRLTWADLYEVLDEEDFINIQNLAQEYGYQIFD